MHVYHVVPNLRLTGAISSYRPFIQFLHVVPLSDFVNAVAPGLGAGVMSFVG